MNQNTREQAWSVCAAPTICQFPNGSSRTPTPPPTRCGASSLVASMFQLDDTDPNDTSTFGVPPRLGAFQHAALANKHPVGRRESSISSLETWLNFSLTHLPRTTTSKIFFKSTTSRQGFPSAFRVLINLSRYFQYNTVYSMDPLPRTGPI